LLITALLMAIIVGVALPSVALVVTGILLLAVVIVAYWRWALELNARARWEYEHRAASEVAGQTSDHEMPAPPRNTKFMIAWCCANIAAAVGVAAGVPAWVFFMNLPLLVLVSREHRRAVAARETPR
jgi:hypothetical protein